MPFRNPFFFSKRITEKFDKARELEAKELKDGASGPAKVNNFKTSNKLTVAKSRNVHNPIAKDTGPGTKAKKVNNAEVNKPVVATSLNEYPAQIIKRRDIQEIVPAVNGKAAPHLVHKTKNKDNHQDFFPVANKNEKSAAMKRASKKT